MNAKINIVGVNREVDAKRLLAKLIRAKHDARQGRKEDQEKKVLSEAMEAKEAQFLAQGMSRA